MTQLKQFDNFRFADLCKLHEWGLLYFRYYDVTEDIAYHVYYVHNTINEWKNIYTTYLTGNITVIQHNTNTTRLPENLRQLNTDILNLKSKFSDILEWILTSELFDFANRMNNEIGMNFEVNLAHDLIRKRNKFTTFLQRVESDVESIKTYVYAFIMPQLAIITDIMEDAPKHLAIQQTYFGILSNIQQLQSDLELFVGNITQARKLYITSKNAIQNDSHFDQILCTKDGTVQEYFM